jgi:large subunit ribosomal protein L13
VAGTKSYQAKPGELTPKWFLVDATDKVVGRLASDIAMVLMGKHRPTYTPHVDTGDYVVVVNCEKVKFSGKKWAQKEYAWFTGYTGQRTESAATRLEEHPDRILRDAVRRMLPKNDALARKMLSKLKLFAGPNHDHQAQQPEAKELGVK